MDKEFVPYEEALALKELGFDEPCFGYSDNKGKLHYNTNGRPVVKDWIWVDNQILPTDMVLAPTFSQAFRWFREKKVLGLVNPIDDWNSWSYSILAEDCMSPFFEMEHGDEYKSYEEAEIACLKKLIELAKS